MPKWVRRKGMTAVLFAAVGADSGEVLGYPPIHLHHMHIVPSPNDVYSLPLKDWSNFRLAEHRLSSGNSAAWTWLF